MPPPSVAAGESPTKMLLRSVAVSRQHFGSDTSCHCHFSAAAFRWRGAQHPPQSSGNSNMLFPQERLLSTLRAKGCDSLARVHLLIVALISSEITPTGDIIPSYRRALSFTTDSHSGSTYSPIQNWGSNVVLEPGKLWKLQEPSAPSGYDNPAVAAPRILASQQGTVLKAQRAILQRLVPGSHTDTIPSNALLVDGTGDLNLPVFEECAISLALERGIGAFPLTISLAGDGDTTMSAGAFLANVEVLGACTEQEGSEVGCEAACIRLWWMLLK
ncbi:hypothetical protein UY3_11133 [Chelonia mydas]|uniref:Uncharacterized protein n=1 Tax=Chelonia mydas TaxID=8469 RepID=M7B1K8_CHEMY|nr:hypothetical protein UY3_11133 [Chelonia mydas]